LCICVRADPRDAEKNRGHEQESLHGAQLCLGPLDIKTPDLTVLVLTAMARRISAQTRSIATGRPISADDNAGEDPEGERIAYCARNSR
jgi:hypothetical protein